MILASHIIVSGLLGAETHNYFFAAVIGFTSHYILDGIPHWDYLPERFKSKAKTEKNFLATKTFWQLFLKSATDAVIGFMIFLIFSKSLNQTYIISGLLAGASSVIPDFLQFTYWTTNWRFLKWNYDIQNFFHYSIHSKIKQAFWPGIIIQATVVGLVFAVLKIF